MFFSVCPGLCGDPGADGPGDTDGRAGPPGPPGPPGFLGFSGKVPSNTLVQVLDCVEDDF